MTTIISVKFRPSGKRYYFSPGELSIKTGDHVIVETARGIEYGQVVAGNAEVEDDKVVQPLKGIIRLANEEDDFREAENRHSQTMHQAGTR